MQPRTGVNRGTLNRTCELEAGVLVHADSPLSRPMGGSDLALADRTFTSHRMFEICTYYLQAFVSFTTQQFRIVLSDRLLFLFDPPNSSPRLVLIQVTDVS